MTDLVLNNITSGYNLSLINTNFQLIKDKINNYCLQNKEGENVMNQDLDMNGHSFLNLATNPNDDSSIVTYGYARANFYQKGQVPSTTNDTDAVNYAQVGQMIAAVAAGTVPENIALYSDLVSTSVGEGASLIGITDASSLYTASNVEGALAEVKTQANTNAADLVTMSGQVAGATNYQQGSTGSVTRTVTSKLQESVSVKDFGAVGDGAADDTAAIQAAINYAEQLGGCIVKIPKGIYKITDTLNIGLIGQNSAILVGDGAGNESGGGGSSAATLIQWWGATAGGSIMVKQSGQCFWGMNNLALDGRYRPGSTSTTNKPDYGLVLDRTQYSRFENVRITGWLRCGMYIQPITSTANDNTSFNTFINVTISGYNPSGVGIELHGNATTFGGTELHTSNVCHNSFVQTVINHAKYGMVIYDADNNSFMLFRAFPRPEATVPIPYGIILNDGNARSNYFFHLQSGGDMLCNANSTAIIYGYDRENGSNLPTIAAGAKIHLESHGNNGLGIFNADFHRNLNAALSGDANLANSNVAEPSLFSVYNPTIGARLSIGTVTSPRAVNIYAHGSGAPSTPVITFGNDTINQYLLGGKKHMFGTAAPTTGAYSTGDTVHNTAPTASGVMGWVCTASGAPGTWKTWGAIGA